MVTENDREILQQVLDLTETACGASLELLERYTEGDLEGALGLLSDLEAAVRTVASAQGPLVSELEHAYTSEMLENIQDTLEEILRSIEGDRPERAAMKMEFQLFPFLRQLKESLYFWGMIYPDPEEMARYYRTEFAEHDRNFYIDQDGRARYKLTVVVAGYNHLETTKRCIKQLLKETNFDALNAELILIDHGSTDGTLEYFEGLGVGKVIHFKKNVRMYMFATLFQLCQSEYFAFVSNDVLVTKDWAHVLLNCMESDSKIAVAVPATPNISNFQMLDAPTDDPEEFIAWANRRNGPDPSRWSDRARLMPPLGMYRTQAVNQLGFADPYFYSMEYWDDDFSLRARRAGYRQIVCGDVACYHFGSVTGNEGQVREGTLVYGRELFEKKNGVDAWGNGFCYDYQAVQIFKQVLPSQGAVTLLGIDCGMGDTPLQIRNELRRRGQSCGISQLTCQKEYLPDLLPHSDAAQYVPDLADGLCGSFHEQRFTCVYLNRDIGMYEDIPGILGAVSRRVLPGGWFIFSCENAFYALTVHALLQLRMPTDGRRHILTDLDAVWEEAKKRFSYVQTVPVEQAINGVEEFALRHFGAEVPLAEITQKLRTQRYYFVCRK